MAGVYARCTNADHGSYSKHLAALPSSGGLRLKMRPSIIDFIVRACRHPIVCHMVRRIACHMVHL